jgi:hypothetical protein
VRPADFLPILDIHREYARAYYILHGGSGSLQGALDLCQYEMSLLIRIIQTHHLVVVIYGSRSGDFHHISDSHSTRVANDIFIFCA